MELPRALLRRIDRLGRRAHAFHRFAHHPLCDAYAGELIALRGRTRICRGCSAALFGASSGIAIGSLFHLSIALTTLAAAIGWLALFALQRVKLRTRPSKLLTRAAPMMLLTASMTTLARAPSLGHAIAALLLIALSWAVFVRYRRRGPDRSPCLACPERALAQPCSGFRAIVRAERAFVRRSERLIDLAIREDERRGQASRVGEPAQ
ncbi:MAG TPA: hypothetical protein VHZ95_08970 [Polyangiales bacterium]|nr:hypothetical protein [Polyangiales bacterium]